MANSANPDQTSEQFDLSSLFAYHNYPKYWDT